MMKRVRFLAFFVVGLFAFAHAVDPGGGASFWTQTGGPRGGVIMSFVRCPDNSMLAMPETGGIFRTADHGATWTYCPLLKWISIRCAAVTPAGHIFVGSLGGGVFRSTDSGRTWTQVDGGPTSLDLSVEAIAVNSRGWIYLFKYKGVYRSKDDGATWVMLRGRIIAGSHDLVNAAIVNSHDQLFAGFVSKGVYRSTDDGVTWTAVNRGLSIAGILSLAVDASDHLFAGSGAIFRSINNGASWSKVMSFPATITYIGQVKSLTVTPDGQILAGTFRGGVYRSSDGGDTWTLVNTGLHDLWVTGVGSDASGYVFAGTNGGAGLYRSRTSSIHWTISNRGLVDTNVSALACNSAGDLFAGTNYLWYGSGTFRSADGGANWQKRGLTDKEVNGIALNPSGHVFVGTWHGLFRSKDRGRTWTAVNAGLPYLFIQALAINAAGSIFISPLDHGVYRSTDDGASWTFASTGLSEKRVYALCATSGGHLFASTNLGVFRSTDSGATWSHMGLKDYAVFSFAAKAGGQIFAGTNGAGVFYSGDDGETWSHRGLNDKIIYALAVNSAGYVFAGGCDADTLAGRAYRSVNNGVTWKDISSGLKSGMISSFAVSPDHYLFAGTYGRGVFKSSAPTDSLRD
jgi:photosystem II stability/assembly factor-like uncharacterized protein